jgi:serine/threonine protein kinase
MTASLPSDGKFAGYRLLRKLGTGSRADVFLASGSSGNVALKVFSAAVERELVGIEADALQRVDSPHGVRLLDIAGMGDELPFLVFAPIRRGSVVTLLRERPTLTRGEVVTVVAPIARLVGELHEAGAAHGNITAASVHLGERGEPVLLGFGHATLFAPGLTPAALDGVAAAVQDRHALGLLATTLVHRIDDASDDPGSLELLRWIDAAPTVFEFVDELQERLFDWAEAAPIVFGVTPGATSDVPARLGAANAESIESEGLPHWLPADLLEDPFGELKRRLATWARGVRRRYWVACGAVLAALLLALMFLPENSPHPPRSDPGRFTPAPAPTATPLPDDPALALPVLLRARSTCYRDLSVLCLDDVDEASSEAFTTDAAAIQQAQQGAELAPVAQRQSVVLVERIGDTALLSLAGNGKPASVLIIRTKAGWRIRDYLSGGPVTNSSPTPAG